MPCSPWQVDCVLNPIRDGRWQSDRVPDFVADLDDVTWIAPDGVRYACPEVTLLFKAKQHRAKDAVDLENAWPLMSDAQRRWLRRRRLAAPSRPSMEGTTRSNRIGQRIPRPTRSAYRRAGELGRTRVAGRWSMSGYGARIMSGATGTAGTRVAGS